MQAQPSTPWVNLDMLLTVCNFVLQLCGNTPKPSSLIQSNMSWLIVYSCPMPMQFIVSTGTQVDDQMGI